MRCKRGVSGATGLLAALGHDYSPQFSCQRHGWQLLSLAHRPFIEGAAYVGADFQDLASPHLRRRIEVVINVMAAAGVFG